MHQMLVCVKNFKTFVNFLENERVLIPKAEQKYKQYDNSHKYFLINYEMMPKC